MKKREQLLALLPVSTLGAMLLYSCYALFAGKAIFAGNRLTMQFGNPHHLAYVCAMSLFVILCFANRLPKKIQHVFYGAVPVLLATIFLTVSRSTLVALCIAVGGYTLVYHTKKIGYAILSILIIGAIIYPTLPQYQQERLTNAITDPTSDRTVRMRIGIWKSALTGIQESPILGNGLRTFTDFDMQYRDKHYEELKANPLILTYKTQRWAHPHSLYLGSLYGWGIVGTLLFIAAFVPAFRRARGQDKKFLFLMTSFNLGFGLTELYIKSHLGAFFIFFPLGMAYGSILLQDIKNPVIPEPAFVQRWIKRIPKTTS